MLGEMGVRGRMCVVSLGDLREREGREVLREAVETLRESLGFLVREGAVASIVMSEGRRREESEGRRDETRRDEMRLRRGRDGRAGRSSYGRLLRGLTAGLYSIEAMASTETGHDGNKVWVRVG